MICAEIAEDYYLDIQIVNYKNYCNLFLDFRAQRILYCVKGMQNIAQSAIKDLRFSR